MSGPIPERGIIDARDLSSAAVRHNVRKAFFTLVE
jgi:hypothetical protein